MASYGKWNTQGDEHSGDELSIEANLMKLKDMVLEQLFFLINIKKGKGMLICVWSVYQYHEGIWFLKLKQICQRDIYYLLVLIKGRNNKRV